MNDEKPTIAEAVLSEQLDRVEKKLDLLLDKLELLSKQQHAPSFTPYVYPTSDPRREPPPLPNAPFRIDG